ncbi:MAG: hypothetical protein NTZ83_02855 [Candidatus Pacearchaeota archaeon]|nr:hypothetical protein [Candidatus Pacearchaeota archaeon]
MKGFGEDKKGFLLGEETLKIIIAVICILFLVYLLVAIYNSNSGDKKIEQAAAVFFDEENGIEKIISVLKDGEIRNIDIIDPSGWHLYSFVGQEKPNSCLNQKCLCICEKSLIEQLKSQAKKCDNKGKCLTVPRLAVAEVDLKIRGADDILFIEIKNQNGKIFIEESR